MTRSTIQRLRLLTIMVVIGATAGSLYGIIQARPNANSVVELAMGAIIGVVISSFLGGFELFGGPFLERGGRRLSLVAAILVRTTIYGIVIMAALLVVPWMYSGAALSLHRPGLRNAIIFSVVATFVAVAILSIAQLIGPRVLVSFLTGRYYHPREEERIVVFLDLVGSTTIAERLGNIRFHALLAEVFTWLSRVVTDYGGEVYRYVGDAMIATWPVGVAEENARPIRCLFACQDALESAASDLLRRHGQMPRFRAGLHVGPLVAGEIGGFKREIALLGDAMNTTARIEQTCRETGHSVLVSALLLGRTAMPAGIVAISIGEHLLRGKSEHLELFALARR